jgi:hypothetical protein
MHGAMHPTCSFVTLSVRKASLPMMQRLLEECQNFQPGEWSPK